MNNTTQFYRAAIGALVINEKNEILITYNHSSTGNWNFPKGGIEKNESDEMALRREIYEELGIKDYKIIIISKISIIYRIGQETIEKENLKYIGQAQKYFWIYIDSKTKFKIPNEEVKEYKWIQITSQNIIKYFKKHAEDGVMSTFLPLEFKEVKALLKNGN